MKILKTITIYLCSYSLLFASNATQEMMNNVETQAASTEMSQDQETKSVSVSVNSVESSTEQYVSLVLLLAISVIAASFMRSCVKKTKDMWVAGLGALILIWGEMKSTEDFADLEYPNLKLEETKEGRYVDSGGQRAHLEALKQSYSNARDTAESKGTLQMAAAAAFTAAAVMAMMAKKKLDEDKTTCESAITADLEKTVPEALVACETLCKTNSTPDCQCQKDCGKMTTELTQAKKEVTEFEAILQRLQASKTKGDSADRTLNATVTALKKADSEKGTCLADLTSVNKCETFNTTAKETIAKCLPEDVEKESNDITNPENEQKPNEIASMEQDIPTDRDVIRAEAEATSAEQLAQEAETNVGKGIGTNENAIKLRQNATKLRQDAIDLKKKLGIEDSLSTPQTQQDLRDALEHNQDLLRKKNGSTYYNKEPNNLIKNNPLNINLFWHNIYALNFGMTAVGLGAMAGFMGKSIPFVDNLIATPNKRMIVWGVFAALALFASMQSKKAAGELDDRIALIDSILAKLDEKAAQEETATGVKPEPTTPTDESSSSITPPASTNYKQQLYNDTLGGNTDCITGVYDQNGKCYSGSDILAKEKITDKDFGTMGTGFTVGLGDAVDAIDQKDQSGVLNNAAALGQMAAGLQNLKKQLESDPKNKLSNVAKEEDDLLGRFKSLAAPHYKGKAAADFFDGAMRMSPANSYLAPATDDKNAKSAASKPTAPNLAPVRTYSSYYEEEPAESTSPYDWNNPNNADNKTNAKLMEESMEKTIEKNPGKSIFQILSNRYLKKASSLIGK